MATIRKRKLKLVTSWQAIIKRKGYPTQRKTFSTRAGAEAWARKIERQIETGEWRDSSEADKTTVADALDRYIREVSIHKKSSYDRERNKANVIKRHKIAQISLSRLRGSDIAEYRDERSKTVKANTVRLDLALLSHMFTVARSEWGMESLDNPVKAIRKPSLRGTARERRLMLGEETALLKACEASGEWWLAPIVRFAIETAARRGEIAYLHWEDVDLSKRMALLRNTKVNNETRSAPLSSSAVKILKELPRSVSGSVFGVKSPDEITKKFSAVCIDAGIEDLHFHDLRHEATSRLFELGTLDIMEIASITGHKTLQMLKRYTHLRNENIANKLG